MTNMQYMNYRRKINYLKSKPEQGLEKLRELQESVLLIEINENI